MEESTRPLKPQAVVLHQLGDEGPQESPELPPIGRDIADSPEAVYRRHANLVVLNPAHDGVHQPEQSVVFDVGAQFQNVQLVKDSRWPQEVQPAVLVLHLGHGLMGRGKQHAVAASPGGLDQKMESQLDFPEPGNAVRATKDWAGSPLPNILTLSLIHI